MLDAQRLIFSIANTGDPLPEDVLRWVNNVKHDSGLLAKRPAKLGLGLLIVQKILLLHNSSLEAATHADSRNVFTFPMPVYHVPSAT